ncbi:MAG TPA: hypothetical protein VMZ92_02385, partial [Planctomycetota bacterium]|nr:hypothetical protein [Planctomycetota bacterium]
GETGVVVAGLTVTYGLENTTDNTGYSPAAGDWKEKAVGDYWLNMGASEFASEGRYIVNITSATSVFAPVSFAVEVRDMTIAELMDGVTLAANQHVIVDSGTVTTLTNWEKTGYSLSATGLAGITAWTVNLTGNITGNLSGSVGSVTAAVGDVTIEIESLTVETP